jgi:hypothetical protein
MGKTTDARAKAIIRGAKLPRITVPLCLRTDLQEEFEAAEQALNDAIQANLDDDSLGGGAVDVEALAAEVERIRNDMADAVVPFRFEARSRKRWPRLLAEHPPREGNEDDARFGMHFENFMTVLIKESTVSPVLDAEDWDGLFEAITDGQWELLTSTLWHLNRDQALPVPFSPAASRIRKNSAAALKQRQASDSL